MQNYTHCGKNFWLGFTWHSIASKCLSCFLCVTLLWATSTGYCVLASTYNISLVSELPSFLFIWFALTNSESEEQWKKKYKKGVESSEWHQVDMHIYASKLLYGAPLVIISFPWRHRQLLSITDILLSHRNHKTCCLVHHIRAIRSA